MVKKIVFTMALCVALMGLSAQAQLTVTNGDFEVNAGPSAEDVDEWYDNNDGTFWNDTWQSNDAWISPFTPESQVVVFSSNAVGDIGGAADPLLDGSYLYQAIGPAAGVLAVQVDFDWGHPDDVAAGRHDGLTVAILASDGTFVPDDGVDIYADPLPAGVTLLEYASYDHVAAGTDGEYWPESVVLDASAASTEDTLFLRFNNYIIDTASWPILDNVVVAEADTSNNPKLVYPVGEENIPDYTPTLQWRDPIAYEPPVYYIYLDPNQDNVISVSQQVEPDPGSPLLVNVSQAGTDPNEYTIPSELAHGERFYWKVEAYNATEPNYYSSSVATFTSMPDEPQIQEHPASQTVPKYSDAVFTIQALNAEEYHWYNVQAGSDVEVGEPNIPTLTITNVQKVDEGYYYCVVTNPNADVPSNTARLMVQRRVAWWNFDSQSINSNIEHPADPNEDFFTGTYLDPNDPASAGPQFSTATPSPQGGYYIEFYGATPEAYDIEIGGEPGRVGEAVLVEPNEFFNFYPQGFTASAWVKVTGGTNWTGFLSKEYRIDPWSGWALMKNPANENQAVIACRQTFAYYADVFSGVDLTQVNEDTGNTWHLVTGMYDTSVSQIYVDGNLEATSDSSTNVMLENTNALAIGAETDEGFAAWDGQIDDVQIYNYPLSRYDVAKLYTDQVAGSDVCITDMEVDDSDLNDDCIVDMKDLAEFAIQWLDCGIVPTCIP